MSTHKKVIWTDKPLVLTEEETENYRQEAREWEKSVYPIGNGRLGCTAFGDPACERIQFNQDTVWVGNECNTGAFQPFGDVYVALGHDDYTDYRRELDIQRAVQTISYQSGGVSYVRELFASYPAQAIVMRLTASAPGSLSGRISMGNVHEVPTQADDDSVYMTGDTETFFYWLELLQNPARLQADREFTSDVPIALDFEARIKVLNDGGTVRTEDNVLVFEKCDGLTLLLAGETDYVADRSKGWKEGDPSAKVAEILASAATKSYPDLLAEHLADYESIFGRVHLDLGATCDDLAEATTATRLATYKEQVLAGQTPEDHELETLLYDYARYLMIGSSRSGHGALPTNLQGIWCINRHPAWRCDFHTDVNIQMNYWFTLASNLADCFTPLADWINSIREVRKEETRRVFGVERGWLMRSENGIFGGSTWHIQKGDSSWLCQNLWDYYTFTLDKEYLSTLAYPIMREISEFWIDHLKELPDGTLVVPEGRSPEHGPVGVDGVTYDQQLCFDLFNNTISATEVLGVDPDLRDELTDKRDRLLKPQVGKWGQFQEWMEDIDDPEDDHRHINHLIGVFPGYHVNPHANPTLAEAAKTSLLARRKYGEGHPGWSKVWKACMFARLSDGELAYSELSEIGATKIYDNLWAVHPPFQIDCNFGYAAAVNEMLVQSHTHVAGSEEPVASDGTESASLEGECPHEPRMRATLECDGSAGLPGTNQNETTPLIQLLPALPKAWPTGKVTGLRVRGGYEVDLAWKNGELTSAVIRGVVDQPSEVSVRLKNESVAVTLGKGESKALV